MKTAFDRRHPAVNFIFFAAVAVLEMLFLHPLFLAISFCGALGFNILLKGKKALKMFFCFYFPLFIFVIILNTLVAHYGVTTLLTLESGNRITLEAVVIGKNSKVQDTDKWRHYPNFTVLRLKDSKKE